MKKSGTSSLVTGMIMLLLSVLLLVGVLTFFAPCGPMEDGSFMACHWIGQETIGFAAAMILISIIHLIVPQDIKLGLGLAMIPVSLLAALVPYALMGSCMMEMMTCNALTKPAVAVVSVLVLIAAAADVIVLFRNRKTEKKGE
ncbi:MAG: DUF4418 family protein [Clostridia bacterium]|nr:DUF4418 family protein [Clostridia bacterium]